MNFNNLTTVAQCDQFIESLRLVGAQIPQELLDRRAELAAQGVTVYGDFKVRNNPSPDLTRCIERTADALLDPSIDATEAMKPVMLYGKIQSGKTRAFVGILSIAFDRGVDIAVVYTKGTNALAKQTVSRMKAEFANFKAGNNLRQCCTIVVHDILDFRSHMLTQYELNTQRHIIVCKKESNNTSRLKAVFAASQLMRQKRVVVIDDEADFGGISFYRDSRAGGTKAGTNARNITETVKLIPDCRNILVTATPYSLYLQPDGVSQLVNGEVRPLKPRHTEVVPVHDRYVGGRQYYVDSQDEGSMYHSVFHPLSDDCVGVLGTMDARYIKNIATAAKLADFRYAVIQYLVGTAIRSIQEAASERLYRSSCILHVQIAKAAHEWQCELTTAFLKYLSEHVFCANPDTAAFDAVLSEIYEDFRLSRRNGEAEGLLEVLPMPDLSVVRTKIGDFFATGAVHVQIVNSDEDVENLLDASGQLELRHEANIFVGGSILDRGITIANLIGFVYGRSPQRMQMDTVLQHARMYGARKMADVAVTRFHTTNQLYARLKRINSMDDSLRKQFEEAIAAGRDLKDVFVCRETDGTIVPCAPNRLLIASLATVSPLSRHLPIGFQTDCLSKIQETISEIDSTILNASGYGERDANGIFELDRLVAIDLLRKIRTTYIYNRPIDRNRGLEWDVEEMIGILEWALNGRQSLYCLRRENRELSRYRGNGAFANAPDDGRIDLAPARVKAVDIPVLMFIRENGSVENGWRGTPFYWPVLLVQQNVRTAIYGRTGTDESTDDAVPEPDGEAQTAGSHNDAEQNAEGERSIFDGLDTLAVDREI